MDLRKTCPVALNQSLIPTDIEHCGSEVRAHKLIPSKSRIWMLAQRFGLAKPSFTLYEMKKPKAKVLNYQAVLELDNRRSLGIGKTKRKAEAAASLNYLNNDYLSGGNFLQLGKPVSAPDTKYPPSKKRKSKLKLEKMIARKKEEEANAVTDLKMEIKSEPGDKGEYYQQTETKFSLEEKCKAGLAFVKMEDASDAVNAGIGLDGTRICGSKVKVEMEDARDVDDAGSGLDGMKILGSRVKIVSNEWKKRDWSRSRDSSGRQGRRRDRSRSKSMSRERKGRRDYGRVM